MQQEDIPFTIEADGKEYTPEEYRKEHGKPQGRGWKAKAAIGIITLASIIGGYKGLQRNDNSEPKATTTTTLQAHAPLTREDTLSLKSLSAQRAYVSNKHLSVERNTLNETREAFQGMGLESIVKTTGLKDLYEGYTGLDSLDHVDYEQALKNLWARKKDGRLSKEFFDEADRMVSEYDQAKTQKTTLEDYRRFLNDHVEHLKLHYDLENMLTKPDGNKVHAEKERFMKNFYEHLDGDLMLAFSMTELFPAINPELNNIILDKMLQEAGPEFLGKIPALGDRCMSFGNFQNSSYTINPSDAAGLNKYLPREEQAPQSMVYHTRQEEHATSAYLNMIHNTKILGNILFINHQLTRFNDLFEHLDEEKRSLLVAGVLSAAHNNPRAAAEGLLNYTDQVRQGKKRAQDIISDYQAPGVQPYYTQSIENALILRQE